MKELYERQLDILNPEEFKDVRIMVIGTGSVGSFVTLTLAKMGLKKIEVWDDDRIEEHNIANQFYPLEDVGELKVTALQDEIFRMSGLRSKGYCVKFNEKWKEEYKPFEVGLSDIVISAVDSMQARRDIWHIVKDRAKLYIDARMGGELMRVFTVKGQGDWNYYEETLKKDGVALPCTARTIIYNVLSVASIVALQVKKYLKDESVSREVTFDMKNMIFQVNRE